MANKPVEQGPTRRALALRHRTHVRIAASGPSRPPLAPHQSAHARLARRIRIHRRRARPQPLALATRAQRAAMEVLARSASQASLKLPQATLPAVTVERGPTRQAPLAQALAFCVQRENTRRRQEQTLVQHALTAARASLRRE